MAKQFRDKEALNAYWREREQNHNRNRIKDEKALTDRLGRKHRESMKDIQEQIDGFYGRYAGREGISIAEARKRVAKIDFEAYERKAKRYVAERNFSARANEEMALYNVTMKINRLELLKRNVELELLSLYSELEDDMLDDLKKFARSEFEKNAGILGDSVFMSEKRIADIVDSSFLSATWSDRLWTNQSALRNELDMLLTRGITQGTHPTALARDLRKKFDTSVFNSERLLITEFARVQKDVFIESMDDAGVEQYKYLAQDTACVICEALDEKVFNVKDAEVGVNMYPMHPFCRCSSSGYIDRDALMAEFDERGLIDREANQKDSVKSSENEVNDGIIEKEVEYRSFDDKAQANEWIGNNTQQWLDSISEEEREAITGYTRRNYIRINEHLRFGKEVESRYKKTIPKISSGLKKFQLKDDIVVYRGVDSYHFDIPFEELAGVEFIDDGFVSTALIRNPVDNIFGKRGYTYEINVPKNTSGSIVQPLSKYSEEYEFLLDKETRFKIIEAYEEGKKKIIKMEVVGNG